MVVPRVHWRFLRLALISLWRFCMREAIMRPHFPLAYPRNLGRKKA